MKRLLTAAAVALLALLAPSGTFAKDYDFDLDDPNSEIFQGPLVLQTGDTVRLVVDENPTTGYSWEYENHLERGISAEEAVYSITIDEHRAHNLRASVEADGDSAIGMAGEGGTRVIEILAQNAGRDILEMVYIRPWEVQEDAPLHAVANAGHHKITLQVFESAQ